MIKMTDKLFITYCKIDYGNRLNFDEKQKNFNINIKTQKKVKLNKKDVYFMAIEKKASLLLSKVQTLNIENHKSLEDIKKRIIKLDKTIEKSTRYNFGRRQFLLETVFRRVTTGLNEDDLSKLITEFRKFKIKGEEVFVDYYKTLKKIQSSPDSVSDEKKVVGISNWDYRYVQTNGWLSFNNKLYDFMGMGLGLLLRLLRNIVLKGIKANCSDVITKEEYRNDNKNLIFNGKKVELLTRIQSGINGSNRPKNVKQQNTLHTDEIESQLNTAFRVRLMQIVEKMVYYKVRSYDPLGMDCYFITLFSSMVGSIIINENGGIDKYAVDYTIEKIIDIRKDLPKETSLYQVFRGPVMGNISRRLSLISQNVSEFQAKLNDIVEPHENAKDGIRLTLGLKKSDEVSAVHARRAAIAAWLAPLQQKSRPDCAFEYIAIMIHDSYTDLFFSYIATLLNDGKTMVKIDNRTVEIPVSLKKHEPYYFYPNSDEPEQSYSKILRTHAKDYSKSLKIEYEHDKVLHYYDTIGYSDIINFYDLKPEEPNKINSVINEKKQHVFNEKKNESFYQNDMLIKLALYHNLNLVEVENIFGFQIYNPLLWSWSDNLNDVMDILTKQKSNTSFNDRFCELLFGDEQEKMIIDTIKKSNDEFIIDPSIQESLCLEIGKQFKQFLRSHIIYFKPETDHTPKKNNTTFPTIFVKKSSRWIQIGSYEDLRKELGRILIKYIKNKSKIIFNDETIKHTKFIDIFQNKIGDIFKQDQFNNKFENELKKLGFKYQKKNLYYSDSDIIDILFQENLGLGIDKLPFINFNQHFKALVDDLRLLRPPDNVHSLNCNSMEGFILAHCFNIKPQLEEFKKLWKTSQDSEKWLKENIIKPGKNMREMELDIGTARFIAKKICNEIILTERNGMFINLRSDMEKTISLKIENCQITGNIREITHKIFDSIKESILIYNHNHPKDKVNIKKPYPKTEPIFQKFLRPPVSIHEVTKVVSEVMHDFEVNKETTDKIIEKISKNNFETISIGEIAQILTDELLQSVSIYQYMDKDIAFDWVYEKLLGVVKPLAVPFADFNYGEYIAITYNLTKGRVQYQYVSCYNLEYIRPYSVPHQWILSGYWEKDPD